jgi:DNA mismatch repair ATPase MutS
MATVDGLTPKQHKALAALLSEPTVTAAAGKVGIGERTLHTWLREPAFDEAYTAARHDAVGLAVGRLQHATGLAVDALVEVLDIRTLARAGVRVAAAKVILDYALRFRELDELESRIAQLEAAAKHDTP